MVAAGGGALAGTVEEIRNGSNTLWINEEEVSLLMVLHHPMSAINMTRWI